MSQNSQRPNLYINSNPQGTVSPVRKLGLLKRLQFPNDLLCSAFFFMEHAHTQQAERDDPILYLHEALISGHIRMSTTVLREGRKCYHFKFT